MKDHKILINLDCLLDTVLGTVELLYPNAIIPLLENGYLSRTHNQLSKFSPLIDDAVFNERYSRRDMEVLRNSKKTNLISLLSCYIMESMIQDHEHPLAKNFKIVINTYPYALSNDELRELFLILQHLLNIDYLTRIHLPDELLTPLYLKENQYDRFIIYDFNNWLKTNLNLLTETKINSITCIIPLLDVHGNDISQDEQEVVKWVNVCFSTVLDVEFVALADMSIEVSGLGQLLKLTNTVNIT